MFHGPCSPSRAVGDRPLKRRFQSIDAMGTGVFKSGPQNRAASGAPDAVLAINTQPFLYSIARTDPSH